MEKIVAQGILYDFYGALLTKHQREVYEQVVNQDLSLSEIAAAEGVSKQAVSDLITRTTAQMERYESKLGLIRQYNVIDSALNSMEKAAEQAEDSPLKETVLQEAARIRSKIE